MYGLSALLITITALTFFCTVALSLLHYTGARDLYANIVAGALVFVVMGVQVYCFYAFANVRFSAIFLNMTYFAIIASVVVVSGGFESPNLVLLVSCPVVSFRIGGRDEGIMNSFFVGLFGLGLMAAKLYEINIENIFAGASEAMQFSIAWVATLIIIAASLSAYDMDA